jgi:hypothetical protein
MIVLEQPLGSAPFSKVVEGGLGGRVEDRLESSSNAVAHLGLHARLHEALNAVPSIGLEHGGLGQSVQDRLLLRAKRDNTRRFAVEALHLPSHAVFACHINCALDRGNQDD